MAWNIQHARGTDGVVDTERIAEIILQAEVDFVALQEIDRGVERTDGRLIDEELAAHTGMYVVFGKTTEWQGGDFGNAILSCYPFEWTRNDVLRLNEGIERRGILQAGVQIDGREVVIMSTHMPNRGGVAEQLMNVEDLGVVFERYTEADSWVGGDFNAEPGSPTYEAMTELATDAWPLASENLGHTEPAIAPVRRIDYVWLPKGSTLFPVSASVVRTLASDHRPVILDLVLSRDASVRAGSATGRTFRVGSNGTPPSSSR